MERFVKGDIVILPFPYTDLSISKKRPALVIANLKGDNIILCQITSQRREDSDAISLKKVDFTEGMLKFDSFIMPTIIFTAEILTISYKIGRLKKEKINEVENKLCEIFTR